ncbi:unnamed protein product [Mytilus edulis]|uniref:PML C-terminal domain-containing protein n=1 Tax=Mytilus edulis TaxID=6550 RepID=A0A8S3QMU9_MYTED|nr:unnamed protein product [Mytilus edulis]
MKVARKYIPKHDVENFKQQTLVKQFVGENYLAHNAIEDVDSLKTLYDSKLALLVKSDDVFAISYHNCMDSFSGLLSSKIVSRPVCMQLAKDGISLKHLKLASVRDVNGLKFVLQDHECHKSVNAFKDWTGMNFTGIETESMKRPIKKLLLLWYIQQALQLPSVTSKLDQFVHNSVYSLDQDGIDIAVNDFQSCINEAANIALKQRKVKITGKKKKDKPWYNTLLHDLKKSLDHYRRALNPFNKELRAKCFHLSKTYNKTRKEKRRNYFKDLMVKLKNTSQSNPKAFWDIINTLKVLIKRTRKVLTNDTPKYHSKIDDIANRLSDWKAQIQARYKHTRVIILECPPYSIVAYNKANGHPNPAEGSLEQTARLEQQIYYLNALIRNINNKNLKVTTKQSKVDLNNNLTESDKAGKTKPNRYTSPNFSSDVLRQTKYQKQQTKYYVDYKVYTDGIHPGPALAKLWLRRICQRIIQLCY